MTSLLSNGSYQEPAIMEQAADQLLAELNNEFLSPEDIDFILIQLWDLEVSWST